MYDSFLTHHGVKGMHWGIRRRRSRSGETPSGGKTHSPRRKRIIRGLKTVASISISVASIYVAARRAGIDRAIAPAMAQSYSKAARSTRTIRRGRDMLNFRNKIDPMLDFRQTL